MQQNSRSAAAAMRRLLLLITLVFVCVPQVRADAIADAARNGGVALLMRHATAPGTFDPDGFKIDDCPTQRNLSPAGREEARRIGAHLKARGLAPGEVLTSQWCRCRDTAMLAFGTARDWPALNSFISNREREAQQVAEILERLARMKPGDKPLALVTHQVIVTGVSGVYPESGEVVVVTAARQNGKVVVKVIGSIKPEAAK
ncbi:MAG: histidine phosphatase family protein [Proteobacteria bacterium]|nr:histidine phosphatase family protein [Pseudomonadota bacterium]